MEFLPSHFGIVFQAFDASGKEIPLIKTGLEGQDQARDLAKEAQQKYVSGRRKHNSRDLGHVHSVMGELKPLQQESEESEKPRPDLDDHLPEGFKLEDLPRFEKIQAWDKSNGVVK